MTVTRSRLFVTQLEDRVVPTVNVLFDFRFDTSGFFTNHPDRIATIRAAAADVGGASPTRSPPSRSRAHPANSGRRSSSAPAASGRTRR